MAEFVEFRMEEVIPEMEEMERLGILTSGEVKKLIHKRKDFEYRLARRSKRKVDFINYINYEMKLLELIRIRRKQNGVYEKRHQIEASISRRVLKQARLMTRLWPSHLDTWTLRINFSNFIGWKEEVSGAYTEQVKFLGNNESVWVAWAKWELEGRSNFDKARAILLSKAPLHHPKSWLIKRELFRLELLYVEMLVNRSKKENIGGLEEIIAENREKVLGCGVARAVYADAVTTLPDPNLYLELYQVADRYEFAHALREEIYRDLRRKFPSAECVWRLKAKRIISGLEEANMEGEEEEIKQYCDGMKETEDSDGDDDDKEKDSDSEGSDEAQENNTEKESNEMLDDKNTDQSLSVNVKTEDPISENPNKDKKLSPKEKLELLISIFDKAMEVVGSEFVTTYIDELMLLLHQCWGKPDMAALIHSRLFTLFDHHTNLLSPLHFYIWYQILSRESKDKAKIKSVLSEGVKRNPKASFLQLELARWIMKEGDTDAQIMNEFKKVGSCMRGESGLTAWRELAKHVCKDNTRRKMFKAAMEHEDDCVLRGMRVLHLRETALQDGIIEARKLYKKLQWRPPFCGDLHAQMVELEMTQDPVNVDAVRDVFSVSIQQQGSTNPGLWLAFIQFEKKFGDPLKTGTLLTQAEKELKAQQAEVFRELLSATKCSFEKNPRQGESEHSDEYFIEKDKDEENDESGEDFVPQPSLVSLFEEELTLSYSANRDRTAFFTSVHSMENNLKRGNNKRVSGGVTEWEKVLELLVGHRISLTLEKVKIKNVSKDSDNVPVEGKPKRTMGKYEPTERLNPGDAKPVKTTNEDDIEKILASSDVLSPDFMQKTALTPYFTSKKKSKEIRKKESVKTKGPGWYNMKAPEMTEEIKRDLEVLQMRSVLDPKRHYKNDMKVLPKHFQLAKVVDSPLDFYSSRIPNKKRKRTMAEEILHDEEALRYQKKKYTEIIASRQKKQFRNINVLKKKKSKKVSKNK